MQTKVEKDCIWHQIIFPILILYNPIFVYTQGIIHNQNKYLLSVITVTELRVETNKFHKINNKYNYLSMMN